METMKISGTIDKAARKYQYAHFDDDQKRLTLHKLLINDINKHLKEGDHFEMEAMYDETLPPSLRMYTPVAAGSAVEVQEEKPVQQAQPVQEEPKQPVQETVPAQHHYHQTSVQEPETSQPLIHQGSRTMMDEVPGMYRERPEAQINELKAKFKEQLQNGYINKNILRKLDELGAADEVEKLQPLIHKFKAERRRNSAAQYKALAEEFVGRYSAREYIQKLRDLGEDKEADRLEKKHEQRMQELLQGKE